MHAETNLLERFFLRAAERPDDLLYTFVDDTGADRETLTAGQLRAQSTALAAHLTDAYALRPGDRVALLYAPSLDFVRALVACLVARVVPVPVTPPNPYNLERELPALARVIESSRARAVLTDHDFGSLPSFVADNPSLRLPPVAWHITSGLDLAPRAAPPAPPVAADDVAFVQYTSGSTSSPRGVLLTFGNLAHQLTCNARDLELGPDARMAMWVPHFHDFGLVSGILSALWGNGALWWMSPLAFVQRPAVWFDVMSRVGATHTAAPNFAYDLAVRKTTDAQRRAWNLRALRVVMSAAEPVRAETVHAFVTAFAASGLDPEAFCPAYGLAEHTVGVSVRGRARMRLDRETLERDGRAKAVSADDPGLDFVGCGRPSEGVTVRVVDPETLALRAPGEVGEIWVDSPSRGLGYDGLEQETRELFYAELPDDARRYLRTGDLGFVHEGELFITGRRKDLLILRGRNLYPQDLEETARNAHPAVRPGGVVAFALRGDAETGDRLALLVELKDGDAPDDVCASVAEAVRAQVLRTHGASCAVVALGRPGAALKTTSGKLRRRECRAAFERGELPLRAVVRAVDEGTPETLDALLDGADASLRRVAADVARWFARASVERRARMFHRRATTLRGWIEVDGAQLPSHPFFATGRRMPVLVRHANGVLDDDAAWDNRGATVRVLDPARPDDLGAAALDLLLTTGRAFLAPTANTFARWMAATPAQRDEIARAEPHRASAAWEMFRAPDSYTAVHYHSKTAFQFRADDGVERLVRYRLRRVDVTDDGAFVRGDTLLPPDAMPRRDDDPRAPDFLHQELRARLAAGAITYALEVQLREASPEALDCTRPWNTDAHPWRHAATLRLDALVDDALVEGLRFNSAHAPASLGPVRAASADDPASLEVLRALVYEVSACARLGRPLPASLAALVAVAPAGTTPATTPSAAPSPSSSKAPAPLRVCVLGAGASGLTAAWKLHQLGHAVTVLERAPAVAGKCATVTVDGLPIDLGGHLATPQYRGLARLCDEVGAARTLATPTKVWSLDEKRVIPWDEGPALRETFLRYRALRDREFPTFGEAGFAGVAKVLSTPTRAWLEAHDLAALGDAIGASYTSTGYGFLADPSLPAMYFLKAAETAGLLAKDGDPALPQYWTVDGGLQSLWERVASKLPDVRTGASVEAIERRDGLVRVLVNGRIETFDRLVVATPLDESLSLLDATLDERALFSRVRYFDYYTVVARATGLPTEGFYILRPNADDPARLGHCVAVHHRHPGSDVHTFYAYGDARIDESVVLERLRDDLARMGGALGEVSLVRRWKYFPHVTADDAREGYYDRLDALQGRQQTVFVGSLFNFELIECNVAWAESVVARHFAGATAAASAKSARVTAPRSADELLAWLTARVAVLAKIAPERVDPDAALDVFALDSLAVTGLVTELSDFVGRVVPTSLVYEQRTLARIARRLADESSPAPSLPVAPVASVAPVTAAAMPTVEPSHGGAVVYRGSSQMGEVRAFWRDYFGVGAWPFEDITFALTDAFVERLVVTDPAGLARVRDRGCLYLANHQVASEPALIATYVSGLTAKRVVGLAKIEGRDSYLGWFMEHMFAYPGVKHPEMYTYLDRSKPDELAMRIQELAEALAASTRNVLVHVQGTRSTTCREPVTLLNPMFIEMALATGAPIVPVRFTGGLPVEPLEEKVDFPHNWGKQTFWIGSPLMPETLEPLGFVERSQAVMAAINELGVSNEDELPAAPDEALGSAVAAWKARTGVNDFFAAVAVLLQRVERPSEGTARLVEAMRTGELRLTDTPVDRWLGDLAAKLYGDGGPRIVTR